MALHSFSEFEKRQQAFERRLPIVASTTLLVGAAAIGFLYTIYWSTFAVIGSAAVGGLAIVALVFSLRGRHELGGAIIIIGGQIAAGTTAILSQQLDPIDVYTQTVFLILATFYLKPKLALYMGAFSLFMVVAANVTGVGSPVFFEQTIVLVTTSTVFLCVVIVLLFLFARHFERNIVARRQRLEHDERLFKQVPDAANRLGATAQRINAMNQEQQRGAIKQSSAITETHRSLDELLKSSQQIASASELASRNAGTSLSHSERAANHVEMLAHHTTGITEVLAMIKELADKSDLLALNASLEGVRAGEAGRGFSIVANQMQILAEKTAVAVVDIADLTQDIENASSVTSSSMREVIELAKTSASATQSIDASIQAQRTTIEDVAEAMRDISTITTQILTGKEQTVASMEELTALADQLTALVEEFRAAAR